MKKILIVDDDMAILDALELALSDAGFEVSSSLKACSLQTIAQADPDIIILDYLLSGTDGATMAQELKNDGTLSRIPIIMISAHPDAKAAALASGAEEFLPKPFDFDGLITLIDKHTS